MVIELYPAPPDFVLDRLVSKIHSANEAILNKTLENCTGREPYAVRLARLQNVRERALRAVVEVRFTLPKSV